MSLRASASEKRRLLCREELRALDDALITAYRQHEDLCTTHPIARGRINRPAIPAAFSESVAAIVLPKLATGVTLCEYGGRRADLIADTAGGGELTFEVKASGVSSWQELKQRDLDASGLIWLDFGRRYVDGKGRLAVHYLPEPSRYEPPRSKLTLDLFLSAASTLDGFVTCTFASLDHAIRSPARLPDANGTPAATPSD